MIKRLVFYSLPEGTDSDKFWKYHVEEHVPNVMKVIGGKGLKKYTIDRVIDVTVGEPIFSGLIEMWWESEEDIYNAYKALQAYKLSDGKTVWDDFYSKVESCLTFEATFEEESII